MGRNQNQAVKRARERNKKLKAEDKRAKRQKRKDASPSAAAGGAGDGRDFAADGNTAGRPRAASPDDAR